MDLTSSGWAESRGMAADAGRTRWLTSARRWYRLSELFASGGRVASYGGEPDADNAEALHASRDSRGVRSGTNPRRALTSGSSGHRFRGLGTRGATMLNAAAPAAYSGLV